MRVHEPLSVLDLLDAGAGDALVAAAARARGAAAQRARRRGAAQLRRGRRARCCRARSTRSRARAPAVAADGPAHLRHRRADPARPRRRADEAARQPAPHAEHDRLRPRGDGLSSPTSRPSHRQHDRPCADAEQRRRRRRLDGRGLRIGIVQARFNADAHRRAARACLRRAAARSACRRRHHRTSRVPGALEIAAGAARHSPTTERATTRWSRSAASSAARPTTSSWSPTRAAPASRASRSTTASPIANAILTIENDDAGRARADDKGRDAARVAVEMANLLDELS